MISWFFIYNQNLCQLSVRLLLTESNTKSAKIEIKRNEIKLLVESKEVVIEMDRAVRLEPISTRQMTVKSCNDVSDYLNTIEMSFVLTVTFDAIPSRRITFDSSLPIDFELMNDWVFCDHNQTCKQPELYSNSPLNKLPVNSLSQICSILSKKICSKYIFESQDKNYTLLIKVINLDSIIADICDQNTQEINHILKFRNVFSVFYKLFDEQNADQSEKSELQTYRLSFDVEWTRIETNLFLTLLKMLVNSTKTVLPLEMRFIDECSLYYGYIDVSTD